MRALTLLACAVAAAGMVLLLTAGPTYRVGLLALPIAFLLLRWAAYAGLAAIAVALPAAAWTYRRQDRLWFSVAVLALVGASIASAVPFGWQWRAGRVPAIHDVSTDLENPPEFEAVLPARANAPNSLERPADLADLQRAGYPDIEPITLPGAVDQVFDRALAAAQDAGWEIVTADKSSGRIEATATSRWFGFKDDVVVRLTPWGSGTRVDVRSMSRLDGTDFGSNARRIRRFLDALRSA